ncbi:MAG TPA: hypothetical protein DEQ09_07565 [Bacteroidales bacterium]|nr:hypothetical protein [Bacteroidales bacterium]
MDCEKVHKDLIFYIEGSLDEETMRSVEDHLSSCSSCAGFADMLRTSLDIIEKEKKIPEDREFTDKVIAGISEERKTGKVTPLVAILRYVAAAAVIIFGVFTGMNIAKVVSGTGDNVTGAMDDEVYIINDLYQEPIESFFLLKYKDDE